MSGMDLATAAENFKRSIVHCDNLVTVHRRAGTGDRGRRTEEVSINRAVVVIAVATWQAAIQDMTLACLDMSSPKASTESYPAYRVIGGRVRKEVGDFATPNAENARRLFQGVGFDPRGSWTWKTYGGRGVGPVTVRPDEVETKLNEWFDGAPRDCARPRDPPASQSSAGLAPGTERFD